MEIKNIIDKHRGSPAMVIGHGPSYNDYIDKIHSRKSNNHIIFDCNYWYCFGEPPTHPHYWILSSTTLTIKEEISRINKYKVPVLYNDTTDMTDRDWIEQNIQCDYLPYDSRHFNSRTNPMACGSGCCNHIVPRRMTIQEELQKYTGYDKHYSHGDTVILFMISFAILTGCNPIYITGMDLSYSEGYAKSNKYVSVIGKKDILRARNNILKDLKIINKSAKKGGVSLINLSKNSSFKTLKIGELP